MTSGPPPRRVPGALTAQQRSRRRALLRAAHPDLGGDPAEFRRVLDAWAGGRRPAPACRAGEEVRFVRRPRGVARLTGWLRASVRARLSPPPPRVR